MNTMMARTVMIMMTSYASVAYVWSPVQVFTMRWLLVTWITNMRSIGSSMLPTIRVITTTLNRLMLGSSIMMVESSATVAITF